jgi:ribosome-associated protein
MQTKSKSQKKREADALQQLGVALVDLRLDQLKQLLLPELLHKAILDAKKITSHGAKRRQAQLIGKLMRFVNGAELFEQYVKVQEMPRAILLKRFEHLDLQPQDNIESQNPDDNI